jgi:hypothetical protein
VREMDEIGSLLCALTVEFESSKLSYFESSLAFTLFDTFILNLCQKEPVTIIIIL